MASPLPFYLGAAALMANDLAHAPSSGLSLLADGDCHLLYYGGFATAERKVIFDLNDFEEVSFAPWVGHARFSDAAALTGDMGAGTALEERWQISASPTPIKTQRDHAALVAAVRDGMIEAYVE